MAGLACMWVFLAILFGVAGPAAIIMSIIAMNKISAIEKKLREQRPIEVKSPPQVAEPLVTEEEQSSPPVVWPKIQMPERITEMPPVSANLAEQMKKEVAAQRLSLELFIGTYGLAIAGSIVVLVGVIFGLKYLYE